MMEYERGNLTIKTDIPLSIILGIPEKVVNEYYGYKE
jgi:hypothetical protein